MSDVREEDTELDAGTTNQVFWWSLGIALTAFVWALVNPEGMTSAVQGLTSVALESLDWFFLLLATFLLITALYLAFSRYGKLRLGRDDERPEFTTGSWLSMLFAAGMGAGLLFWGIAEPITHFQDPPGLESRTAAAAREAFVVTNLHWGLHAWAIYGMCALVIAYFTFRRGMRPLTSSPIRSAMPNTPKPLLISADVLAVQAVLFGIVGTLVMGVLQLRAGVTAVFNTDPESTAIAMGIIVLLTVSYMLSASTGLDKGIKILSNINILLTVALLIFIVFFGPTRYIASTIVTSIGDYLSRLFEMAFRLFPFEGLTSWTASWTLTYFLWWLAWGPFVGIFIARISRGRTIREFVLGVVLVPAAASLVWFGALGGAGIFIELEGPGGLAAIATEDAAAALFAFLDYFPLGGILSLLALAILFVFLVTSADSGTFVLGIMTENGNQNPRVSRKLLWGALLAGMTLTVTLVADVQVARAMAIFGAVPFTAVLVVQMAAFLATIRTERINLEPPTDPTGVATAGAVTTNGHKHPGDGTPVDVGVADVAAGTATPPPGDRPSAGSSS
jgi:glycine betaine transporter